MLLSSEQEASVTRSEEKQTWKTIPLWPISSFFVILGPSICHIPTVLSAEAVANSRLSSGEKVQCKIRSRCLQVFCSSCPDLGSHSATLQSTLEDMSRIESGEKLTAVISALWQSFRVCFLLKVLTSQMMIVLSTEEVASNLPSGLNAQQSTESSCLSRLAARAPWKLFLEAVVDCVFPIVHLHCYTINLCALELAAPPLFVCSLIRLLVVVRRYARK